MVTLRKGQLSKRTIKRILSEDSLFWIQKLIDTMGQFKFPSL